MLTKTCAAQDIGPVACWLVTVIAHQEDAKRYSGAVTFYNEQLMPLLGIGGKDRLERARTQAVDAGWLHYEKGSRGVPGRYWVSIPDKNAELPDTPIDESDVGQMSRPEIGRQPGRKPDGKPASFFPTPIP